MGERESVKQIVNRYFPQWTRMENGDAFPFVCFHAPKREVHARNLSFITLLANNYLFCAGWNQCVLYLPFEMWMNKWTHIYKYNLEHDLPYSKNFYRRSLFILCAQNTHSRTSTRTHARTDTHFCAYRHT